MASSGTGDSSAQNRILLATVGILLLAVATAGFLLGRSEVLAGAFLVIGAALIIVSSVVSRLEGQQEIGPTGVKLNIAAAGSIERTESELLKNKLPAIEDVV